MDPTAVGVELETRMSSMKEVTSLPLLSFPLMLLPLSLLLLLPLLPLSTAVFPFDPELPWLEPVGETVLGFFQLNKP